MVDMSKGTTTTTNHTEITWADVKPGDEVLHTYGRKILNRLTVATVEAHPAGVILWTATTDPAGHIRSNHPDRPVKITAA